MRTYFHYLFGKLKVAIKSKESRDTFLVCLWLFSFFVGTILLIINSMFEFKLGLCWIVPAIVFGAIGYAPLSFFAILNFMVYWRSWLYWTLAVITFPYTIVCWLYHKIRDSYRTYKTECRQ